MIGVLGRATPGFKAVIVGSLQVAICPVKIFNSTVSSRRRLVICDPVCPGRLYIRQVAPATSGRYWYGAKGARGV